VPELQFFFDEIIEKQDRIERILLDLERERAERPPVNGAAPETMTATNRPATEQGRPDDTHESAGR
jgi:hypothetical protein